MAKYIDVDAGLVTRYPLTERIWLGPDGKIYPEGKAPDGSQFLGGPGKTMSVEDAEKYGLIKASAPAEDKADEPDEDKAVAAPENKAISTRAIQGRSRRK